VVIEGIRKEKKAFKGQLSENIKERKMVATGIDSLGMIDPIKNDGKM
jgi:hypothetical protein